MNRRKFLKSSASAVAASAAAGAAGAGSAIAQATSSAPAIITGVKTLSLAAPIADSDGRLGGAAFRLARNIEAATGGRYAVAVHRSDVSALESLYTGDADVALGFEHHNAALHPAFHAFAGLPIGQHLTAAQHMAWLAEGGQALWDALAAGFGAKPFVAGHTGAGSGLWSMRPMTIAEEFNGARISVPGLARTVAASLGGVVIDMGLDEVRDGLARGTITVAETAMPPAAPLASWRHATGLMPGGLVLSAGVRLGLWSKLGRDDRAAITHVMAREADLSRAEMAAAALQRAHAEQALAMPTGNVSTETLTHRLVQASADAVATVAATDHAGRRIFENVAAFRRLVNNGQASLIS